MAVAVYGTKIGEMGLEKCPEGYVTHTVDAHGPIEQVCCPEGLEPRPVGTDKYGCFAQSGQPMPQWVQDAMRRTPAAGAFVLPSKEMVITVSVVAGVALVGVSWAFYRAFRSSRRR